MLLVRIRVCLTSLRDFPRRFFHDSASFFGLLFSPCDRFEQSSPINAELVSSIPLLDGLST